MGQGQPRVIIWTTLVVLPYTMLHTKFQGHWSTGSGEEDFLRFLPYMGMAAMLVMWPRPFEQFFFPKGPGGCIWNLVAIGPVVSEEKSFEIVDGWTTDGWMHDGACLYYKLPRSLRLRWAKKKSCDIYLVAILDSPFLYFMKGTFSHISHQILFNSRTQDSHFQTYSYKR